MGLKRFDKKFGAELVAGIPTQPGVYFFHDAQDAVIYVGKAKDLRRRLSQYRNTQRIKKHRKMRAIVTDAVSFRFEVCSSEQDASYLEARLIQRLRPRWNVAGAFHFMYPMVGVKEKADNMSICFTTSPAEFALDGYTMHGSFRSRQITGEAFFSWANLLGYVGHKSRTRSPQLAKYSYTFEFRKIPTGWAEMWNRFLKGEAGPAMENLVLALVENAAARRDPKKVQRMINDLRRFRSYEVAPLWRARRATGFTAYPVPQIERDLLFLDYRFTKENADAMPSAVRRPESPR